MKTVFHKSNIRGHANHGWLDSHHTFSFAGYYDPERMNFGALRVLNDDIVDAGMGFGRHPHDNMEIISVPLEGELEHQDSMGNKQVIKKNEIQVMSAGTGIVHSEYNRSKTERTNFLQIWVIPNKRNVSPRYDQLAYDLAANPNQLLQVLSPNKDDAGVWAHQEAWFHLGKLEKGTKLGYELKKKGNGVYAFLLDGELDISGNLLEKRDGLGVWETEKLSLEAKEDSFILLMEVPMG
ncbi:pirin family protein [Flammeovirgaceae bacterium SG7u.111]|nr:pirin family protein [Flammeovirgaceae bacterium SG7u.132]WPO37917.1 pirin family protein [Flammeovirgaceae bacterium SG7u.111]